MFAPEMYQLIDFGDGRRLERFSSWVLDRPSPAVEKWRPRDPEAWSQADARFERGPGGGQWVFSRPVPPRWTVEHRSLTLELKPTGVGHLGLFPEQADNWDWLDEQVRRAGRPLEVLNLFAYTVVRTLAAAAAGAAVTHVDAAGNVVAWARRNAELSRLADAPIRWITDDAMKFVRREVRRGARYDAVVLDPPSYGHGARGEVWRLAKHLPRLLALCAQLTAASRQFVLLTCHTPEFGPKRLEALLAEAIPDDPRGQITATPMTILSADGRALPSGTAVRWERL